jgi:type II secretory pathway pseudopilin PulG
MRRQVNAVVVALVGGLAVGLILPAVAKSRTAAASSKSKDNLRTIGQGVQAFAAAYDFFPGNGGPPAEAVTTPDCRTGFPDSESFRWGYGDPKRAGRLQSGCWAYSILPCIGEEEAFRTQDQARAVPVYYIGTRRPAEPQAVPKADPVYAKWTYQDAGLKLWGRTDYAANDQVVLGGNGNVMKPDRVTDGLAETALVGEKAMDADAVKTGGWYWDEPIIFGGSGGTGRKGNELMRDAPKLLEKVADNWGSPDPDGVWFLFCDGHARKLPYTTKTKIVGALITPDRDDSADLD